MATIFSLTGRANPNLVAERIRRQQWRGNWFGMWVAPEFIKKAGVDIVPKVGPDGPSFTGAPVEVHRDFVKHGKTTLDIATAMRLVKQPVFGDKPLAGTGEGKRVIYRTVRINVTRKAYTPPSLMSAQITVPWLEQEMLKAEADLTRWWNDYHPGNFIYSLCAGASLDLVAPSAEGGRGVGIVSHPNFYVAGVGQVSYAGGKPGTAGYESAVASALAGMTDTSQFHMRVGLVRNLVVEAQRKRIAPIVIQGGYRFYAVWISDAQWVQLQEDPEFKDFYKRLPEALKSHPLATGAVAYIAGAVIYTDMSLFGARINATDSNVTAGTVEYGPAPTAAQRSAGYKVGGWIENLDTSNLKIGFIVGQSALHIGIGVPVLSGKKQPTIAMTEQYEDHGALTEIGIATIQSVVRGDDFDQDAMVTGNTAGDFQENTGSLAFATYSRHQLAWE